MSAFDEIKEPLARAIDEGDQEEAARLARYALEAGVGPVEIFNQCLIPTLRDVGDRFARLEIFLPEMMLSAEAAKGVIALLEPVFKAQKTDAGTLGKVVIGTVNGDIHDIGKDMQPGPQRPGRGLPQDSPRARRRYHRHVEPVDYLHALHERPARDG
jgi:methanogenic corrinoid protein MtbC1